MSVGWWQNETVEMRRDQVRPGMVVHSSHGYRLLVTQFLDTADVRTDRRHVQIQGHLHADRNCSISTERDEAGSMIQVETPVPMTADVQAALELLADWGSASARVAHPEYEHHDALRTWIAGALEAQVTDPDYEQADEIAALGEVS